MRIFFTALLVLPIFFSALCYAEKRYAEKPWVISAESSTNRAALFELYTSEGCSSCPPADKWLSSLKKSGVSGQYLIPLAFHVTYWDYIGWQDRFGSGRYDERQRSIARFNRLNTIYTPQFVLNGDDYRSYNQFARNIDSIISQPAEIGLKIIAHLKNKADSADVEIKADISNSKIRDLAIFLVIYENDLVSNVNDGENEGILLHHDFVVRQLYGPYLQSMSQRKGSVQQQVSFERDWKNKDMGLVAFAQDPHTGEILQAVNLAINQKIGNRSAIDPQ